MHDLSEYSTHVHKGYLMVYMPDHPNAWQSGSVYFHRLMMENKLGRYLKPEEHVHHIDGDVLNNSPENLTLTNNRDHTIEHHKLAGHAISPFRCLECNKEFTPDNATSKYCSTGCSRIASRKVIRPSKEDLEKMVWSKPCSRIAQELGVSGKAIEKWCRQYNIEKPGRGYWQKQASNKAGVAQ